jgi:hypothetical protein
MRTALRYAVGHPQHQQLSLADKRQKAARRKQPSKKKKHRAGTAKPSVSEILVELVGRDVAETLIAVLGGTRIWIPTQSDPTAKLAQILGTDAASKLSSRFGGDYLQIPNTVPSYGLHHQTAELHRQGYTINEIALAVGRSRRTVFRLLRKKVNDFRRPAAFASRRTDR